MDYPMEKARVMIVEDKAIVAEDCRCCLENLGYTVSAIVASGEESVEKAEKDEPDVVLMDISLRDEMDGIRAAELIYSRFGIPVVFLTAYSDPPLLEKAKKVGSYGYLVKPFEENELYVSLEMALYKARAEKERKRLEARLQQAQMIEAIGTLAGGIAHQFNNALAVITGAVGLVQFRFQDDEELTGYMKNIKAATDKMSLLTKQLLAYAGGGGYQQTTIELTDLVRDTMPLLVPALDPKIEVDAYLPEDIFRINADMVQMQMVLSAVMTNAAEALQAGGRIHIHCSNVTVPDRPSPEFPDTQPGKYACLTVTDNGDGMDEETMKRMFEPFFSTKFAGRGLGMAATHGFIRNHNGAIKVESKIGQGTSVHIYIPAAEGQE